MFRVETPGRRRPERPRRASSAASWGISPSAPAAEVHRPPDPAAAGRVRLRARRGRRALRARPARADDGRGDPPAARRGRGRGLSLRELHARSATPCTSRCSPTTRRCTSRSSSTRACRTSSRRGRRAHPAALHGDGQGAAGGDGRRLPRRELARRTPNTLVTVGALRAELDRSASAGSRSTTRRTSATSAASAPPVRDHRGADARDQRVGADRRGVGRRCAAARPAGGRRRGARGQRSARRTT